MTEQQKKSLELLRAFLSKRSAEADAIFSKVDGMKFDGPTTTEYFENFEYQFPHLVDNDELCSQHLHTFESVDIEGYYLSPSRTDKKHVSTGVFCSHSQNLNLFLSARGLYDPVWELVNNTIKKDPTSTSGSFFV